MKITFWSFENWKLASKKLLTLPKISVQFRPGFFAISAETPKLTETPISAETETETEISVGHYQFL